jgi:hypothetical protein
MTDDPFNLWPEWPPPVVPRPPELLFALLRDQDWFSCELRYKGAWSVEALFFRNDQPFVDHRFDTRELALNWAEIVRTVIEKGGLP